MYILSFLKIFGALLFSLENNSPLCLAFDKDETLHIYNACNLHGEMKYDAFDAAYQGFVKYHPNKNVIGICDFTLPSNEKRFYLIDMENQRLILKTYVAHGKNSGEVYATKFSNTPESLQSSLGFYKVVSKIISPKHGDALLLDGMQKGLNDNAMSREIIMHGADYVSEDYIRSNGRLGRSYGCPALPREDMQTAINFLANGGLLFVYGK